MSTLRIGCGSGWERDRTEPAVDLAQRGDVRYLCFECLAERTLGLAQLRKIKDPRLGYNPLLKEKMEALLPVCAARGVRLIGNWGAANPKGAAQVVRAVARRKGIRGLKVATITGDDMLSRLAGADLPVLETGGPLSDFGERIVSANAYLGAEGIVRALNLGADVVVGGRIADPSLFLGPLIYEFNWPLDAWDVLAAGQVVGHLLECGAYVTGGYFADPGYCDVQNLVDLAYPFADVRADGEAVIGKLDGTGGVVNALTCKAQLVYEIHDPGCYVTPDVIVDVRQTTVEEVAKNRVRVRGAKGRPRPQQLKVCVCVREGFTGEGEVSFAGPGARQRGELCLEIIKEQLARLQKKRGGILETRFDIIGCNSIFGRAFGEREADPGDLRVRFAARCRDEKTACLAAEEGWHALMGPAGAGGARSFVRQALAMYTVFVPREMVLVKVEIEEV